MKKLYAIWMVLLMAGTLPSLRAQYAPASINATIFEETFNGWNGDSLTSSGWTKVLTSTWNYIDPQDNSILFYKQEAANWVLLVSPGIDLTGATMLIFDYKRYSSIDNMKLKIGIMNTPTDTTNFTMLNLVTVNNPDWITDTIFLSGYTGVKYIGFNAQGPPPYTLFYLDHVIVKGDAVQANWPSPVTNLAAVAAPNGGQYATVSWTNPSTEADGNPLTDLDSIVIQANNGWAAHLLNPQIGQPASIQVPVDSAGFWFFTATAYNTAGASSPRSTDSLWVGLDTPGPVMNLVMTVVNDSTSSLSWSAPTAGEHGAYYDGVVDAYRVIRADGEETLLNSTTFTMGETLGTPGTYNYEVIAVNSSGPGAHAASNAGAFYFAGYLLWEDFWVDAPAFGWTESGDGKEKQWGQGIGAYSGGVPPEAYFGGYSWPFYTGIHRMVSPVLNTTGFTALSLDFDYSNWWSAGTYTFRIETTSDGGNSWHAVWSRLFSEDQPPTNLNILIKNEDVGSGTFQYAWTFEGDNQNISAFFLDAMRLYPSMAVDVSPVSLAIPDYIRPGDPVTASGEVKSYGSLDTAYTARLVYYRGADTVYSSAVTRSIAAGATDVVTFDPWTAVEGDYQALLKVSCPGDERPGNNSISAPFGVYNANGTRTLVVCEDFTGTWCGYCPGAAMGLDDLIANSWPVAVVSYHNGDEFETPEGMIRDDYYGVEGYPTVHFDGIDAVEGGYQSTSMYPEYLPLVQARLNVAPPATVTIGNLNQTDSTLTGTIVLGSGSPMLNPGLRLRVVLTETHIPRPWQNQSEVNFCERAMFGGATGTPVDLDDKSDTIPFSLTISRLWNREELELVAFLQDTLSREIYNGNKASLDHVGIVTHGFSFSIYPNPVRERFIVRCDREIESVTLYDLTGRLHRRLSVNAMNPIVPVDGLSPGIYVVNVKTSEGENWGKIVVR